MLMGSLGWDCNAFIARYIKGMLEDRLTAMIKPQCLGPVKTLLVGCLGSTILMEEIPVKQFEELQDVSHHSWLLYCSILR